VVDSGMHAPKAPVPAITIPDVSAIVRASRRAYSGEYFDIRRVRCDGSSLPCPGRVIVVTPRKSGIAVKRNLFKRRVRAVFRLHSAYVQEYYWVFFAKSLKPACTFSAIVDVVSQLCSGPAQK